MLRSKCLKFVNGLRPDINKAIGYQQIARFSELVNKSRIYDEDSMESASYYKSLNDKKRKGQFRGKPYVSPNEKGKQKEGYDISRVGEELTLQLDVTGVVLKEIILLSVQVLR